MSLTNYSARGKSCDLVPNEFKTEMYLLYPSFCILDNQTCYKISFDQSPSTFTWLSFKKLRYYIKWMSTLLLWTKRSSHACHELTVLKYLDQKCRPFLGIGLFSLFAFAGLEQLLFLPCHLFSSVWTLILLLGQSIRKDYQNHLKVIGTTWEIQAWNLCNKSFKEWVR